MPTRNKPYRRYVESLPCAVNFCKSHTEVAAHHSETCGVGMKGSDYTCIPLCYEHHILELHAKGEKSFYAKYRIDLPELIAELVGGWFTDEETIYRGL